MFMAATFDALIRATTSVDRFAIAGCRPSLSVSVPVSSLLLLQY